MPTTAIILCGGQSKRLRPLTDDKPKCMVLLNNRPILDYQIKFLRNAGVKKIILACGYKWEKIKEHYKDQLVYSPETEPLGTGGAVKLALKFVDEEEFFVLNSDDILDLDYSALAAVGSPAIVVSHFHSNFGIVDIDENNNVLGFRQKPLLPFWANAGIYVFNKSMPFPEKGDHETTTLQKIKLKAYKHDGYWITINTVKDLEDAEKFFKDKNIF